jgi:hypothetical protein
VHRCAHPQAKPKATEPADSAASLAEGQQRGRTASESERSSSGVAKGPAGQPQQEREKAVETLSAARKAVEYAVEAAKSLDALDAPDVSEWLSGAEPQTAADGAVDGLEPPVKARNATVAVQPAEMKVKATGEQQGAATEDPAATLDATAAVPVNWMVMDDCRPERRVRYFVIEGSNSLASWQVGTVCRCGWVAARAWLRARRRLAITSHGVHETEAQSAASVTRAHVKMSYTRRAALYLPTVMVELRVTAR